MKADDFDKKVNDGENILDELDISRAQRPDKRPKRGNLAKKPRKGWSEQFKAMADAGDDRLLDEPLPTKFDIEEWE